MTITNRASIVLLLFGILFCNCGRHAIAQIAPGVTQSAAQTATVTGKVLQKDGTSIAGAILHLTGPSAHLTTVSDIHGDFVFTSVPYGTYNISANVENLGVASRDGIFVKGDMTVAIQYVAQNADALKTIANVSTRTSGASINVTPASIASINPSDYAFQGNASWKPLLNGTPGVAVTGGLTGGASCTIAIPGSPIEPTILSINGALPYETSVTLDGMPIQNVAPTNNVFFGSPGIGTDVSFLPLPAFDTADIVRGPGANAPSIANSIGGSFVVHAPGRIDHSQFNFSTSTDPYGGTVSNLKAAVGLGKLSATLVYGVNDSPGPVNGNVIPGVVAGILTINGNPVKTAGEIGFGSSSKFPNCALFCGYRDTLVFCCTSSSSAWTQHNGALSLSYDLSPSVSVQVFYAGSSSMSANYPAPYVSVAFTPDTGYAGNLSPGSYVYPDFFEQGPIQKSESLLEEKITAYMSRGVIRLAAMQDNSFYNVSFPNLIAPNGSYVLYGTAYYSSAPSTPVNFNGISAQLTFLPFSNSSSNRTNNRDLLASYDTQVGPLSHIGASFLSSYYNAPRDSNGSTFGVPSTIILPPSVSERTDELRLHGGIQLSDHLTFDASWYIARGTFHLPNPSTYNFNTSLPPSSWVDSVFSYGAPRLSAVWRASRDIAIRGAAGGGFALPPIGYLTKGNTVPTCSSGICNVTIDNLNLQAEKSFGFDLGTDIRLHRDTILSFDLYHTDLYGQFFQSTSSTGTYLAFPLYTTQYQNLSRSRFEGANLDVRRDPTHGLYWHAALGLTRGYVVSVPAGFYNKATCSDCANTYIVAGINFDGAYQGTVPYASGSAQIGYRWSPEKYVDLSPTYYGNNNPYFQPAFIELDGHVGYPLTRNISLLATLANITGIHDQPYQTWSPTFEIPLEGSASPVVPAVLVGIPYGPRTVTITARMSL